MNEMQVFQNSEFGELGVLEIDDKPFFPATACAKILGYSNPWKAILDHCKKDGLTKREVIDSMGRTQHAKFITEGNLYRLIAHSKLPAAERFEKWVFDEVLPTIRKTGGYGSQTATMDRLLDKLVQVTANLTQAVTTMATVMEQMRPVPGETISLNEAPLPVVGFNNTKCKLESFPPQIVRKVEEMLVDMQEQQNLNFSMIARFCTINGYAISSPAVKTYYQRHFSE